MNIESFSNKHAFKIHNTHLYEIALTHPSYNSDAKTKHEDYERLEYIGDSVIGFVSADIIFKTYPKMNQGDMSKLRSNLVRTKSLAKYARNAGLADLIRTGHSIDSNSIISSDKILEDVFEALVGAIYLDNDINVAYKYIKSFLYNDIKHFNLDDLTDAKTKLQEEMQAEHRDSVHYELVNQTGPAHDRTFEVQVMFNNVILAYGRGKSKKEAEENAAKNALKKRSV